MAHQISTILIKSQTASGEEEEEEIELDDAATLFEQFSMSGNVSVVEGTEVIDMQDILQNIHAQNSSIVTHTGGGDDGGGTGTYIFNPETGEIQMIDLNASIIGGDVEVVTVDAEKMLGGGEEAAGGVHSEQTAHFSGDVKPPTMASHAFLKGRTTHAVPIHPVSRFKSAPALLRNSRRALPPPPPLPVEQMADALDQPSFNVVQAASSSSSNNKASSSTRTGGRRTKRSIAPKTSYSQKIVTASAFSVVGPSSTPQIFMINPSNVGQISQLVGTATQPVVQTIQMKDGSRNDADEGSETEMVQKQPTYYIYQDDNGDQVAELVEDSSSASNVGDQPASNIMYQFENNSIFLQEGDLTNLGTLTLTLPKKTKPKVSRKRPKKETADIKNEDGSVKLRRGQTELKCLEKGCQAIAFNVLELRKHLTIFHDVQFDLDTMLFPSDAAFKEWREQYERDRMVSFIYRGGTKKIAKDQAVTYMICHRSGHYKPTMVDTSQRKRKMKPQGSCKIGGYCTAGIKLLKNLETGEVKMDICHTHYGHPLDNDALPHLRVNPTLRKMILRKFEEGLTFTEVLAYIHHNPDGLEGLRMVDRRAVRNIFDTWKNPVKRVKKPSTSNETSDTPLENSLENLISTESVEASENPDMGNLITEAILPNTPLADIVLSTENEEPCVKRIKIDHIDVQSDFETIGVDEDSAYTEDDTVSGEAVETTVHIITDEQSDDAEDAIGNNTGDEESAPILHVAYEDYLEDDQLMDDDSNPPLLIAIDSVKSLKPVSPAPVSPQSPSSPKLKDKGKKAKKRGKKSGARANNKPIIIKTESIQGRELLPTCSKVTASYDLRTQRKVEVNVNKTKKGKKCPAKVKTEQIISNPPENPPVPGTSKSKTQDGVEKIKGKRLLKYSRTITSLPPSPSVVEVEMTCSSSPLPCNASSDIASDQDDFDFMQIQISPEMDAAIDKLNNHGESGPTILLYKKIGDINTKYGGFCRAFHEDDFCLIIQTPVQRQIMQMFPKVIGIEILDGPKPNEHDLKLAFLMVLDDFREAIPVAWMVADTMCSRVLNQFFRMLRYHCGELQVQYIMAPKNADIYKTWTAHFSNKPKMLQSEFCARRDLRNLVNRHFPNDSTRAGAMNIVENLISEKQIDNLKGLKDKLCQTVKGCPNGQNFLRKLEKDWFARIEEWSCAFRIAVPVNLLFVADGFLELKKFVSFKGTRKLNQSINHILKIGYDKCFLRTKRLFKGDQKFSNMLEKVEKYHKTSKDSLENATVLSHDDDENTWTIESENGNTEEVFYLQSRCYCKIMCSVCKICMHEYMCSCKEFAKFKVMCPHIHKVHCYRNPEEEEGEEVEGLQEQEVIINAVHADKPEIITVPTASLSFPVAEKQPEMALCEGAEITILNESQLQELNLTGFLNASSSGLFRNEEGQEMPKIVSITDADTQKVLYGSSGATPFIFHLSE